MTELDQIIEEYEFDNTHEKYVFIGNFAHCKSNVSEGLLPFAAALLSEYGWENDFALYYHPDGIYVRLYFRLAYVASCYLDGVWEEIAEHIPFVVPLIKATIELRKIKNLGMLWIERNCKDFKWINLNNNKNNKF